MIALIGLLATIAVPNFQEMVKRNAVTSQNNELVALINTAKSEAIRRSITVTVEIDGSGTADWKARLLDPDDPDSNSALRETSNSNVRLAGAESFTFNSRGYLGEDGALGTEVNLSLFHANCTGQGQHRKIDILPTGQLVGSPDECPPN